MAHKGIIKWFEAGVLLEGQDWNSEGKNKDLDMETAGSGVMWMD